jgi:hypothetical protein
MATAHLWPCCCCCCCCEQLLQLLLLLCGVPQVAVQQCVAGVAATKACCGAGWAPGLTLLQVLLLLLNQLLLLLLQVLLPQPI